jgi:3-deoxy-D-manno-octulosonic-acid transferase
VSILYSVLLFFALAALLPVYFLRLKVRKGESLHLAQRLGLECPRSGPGKQAVWIHAVSVGEVLSLQNLVRQLRKRHPSWRIFFSTLTNSGYRMAREKLQGVDRVFFMPFDFGWSMRRVLDSLRPSVLVLAESEFWPNLLRQAKRHSVSVILANGRVSDRSFARYLRVKRLARALWRDVDLYLVQTQRDRDRLESLGVEPRRVRVAGNLKCEVRLKRSKPGEVALIKKRLGVSRGVRVVVAGSTRAGEEALILQGFRAARRRRGDVCLVLAPRHPERVEEVERACRSAGWSVARKTRLRRGDRWDILILDTLGELAYFYALGDAAFVGGSLVPWGGHNILEPAFYGKPVFFGPFMRNFAHLAEIFVRAGGAAQVRDRKGLADLLSFQDEKAMKEMGRRAKSTLDSLQGATAATIRAIEDRMPGATKSSRSRCGSTRRGRG